MIQYCRAAMIGMGVFLSSLTMAGYSGGDGSAEFPFQISSIADWQELVSDSGHWGQHYILMNDINFEGLNLTPVAPDTDSSTDNYQGTTFTGVFDGQGYSLSNAVIHLPEHDFVGLFGRIGSRGQILNLNVHTIGVIGRSRVGGLCGQNFGGTIRKCNASGVVSATLLGNCWAGGLVGATVQNGMIVDCYSMATVTGDSRVGGLTGQLGTGEIRRCYATGKVIACGIDIGGLAGVIYEPTNSGTIVNSYATGNVNGTTNVGGLVGQNYRGKILYCYSIGKPTGSLAIGGLCGIANSGTGYHSTGNFWDTQTSGISLSAMGTGRTTTQMQTPSTFSAAGWNLVHTWQLNENQTYPLLREDADDYSGGDGSSLNPYEIVSVDDLIELTVYPFDWSKHFVLKANLNLTGIIFSKALIGRDTSTDSDFQGIAFSGLFDGNGYIISNLTIDATVSDKDYLGLFGQIDSGGEVRNLGLENLSITGGNNSEYLGGLCGANLGKLSNCYVTGTVENGYHHLGGLCGVNAGGVIEACHAFAAVAFWGEEMTYCLGGLCGANENSGYIRDCYATGSVTGVNNSLYLGGLCGRNSSPLDGRSIIEDCYASGSVSAGRYSSALGGLCGSNSRSSIEDSYSLGTVTGGDYASELGGLCGRNYDASIIRCYATGRVVSGFDSHSLGGLCGANGGTIAKCFWDIQTSQIASGVGVVDSGHTDDYAGKTTAQMQMQSTFADAGWKFANFQMGLRGWYMPEQGYPGFDWQNPAAGKVPDVSGLTVPQVHTRLTETGLTAGPITNVKSWKTPAGIVTGLNACSGGYVDTSIRLSVFVSSGSDGDGSAENPYEIACKTDMDAINTQLASSYIMTSDIYLGNNGYYTTAVIAPNSGISYEVFMRTPFSGFFDGNDHVICNLSISASESSYIGLFGCIGYQGAVADLGIINSNVRSSYSFSGLLCGKNLGAISNCFVGESSLYGFASSAHGGLCGENVGDIRYCCVIDSVVTGNNTNALGIVCGGNRKGSIRDSYARGSNIDGYSSNFVGGLCGSYYQGSISNCFFAGRIVGEFNPERLGGFCGYNNQGVFSNCFWDMEMSGLSTGVGGGIADGVTGKTTGEMKMLSTFVEAGWDFGSVWAICEGMNTPRLQWQIPTADRMCPDGVGVEDLGYFAMRWLMGDCGASGGCEGADLDGDGTVGLADWAVFAGQWMAE